MLISGEPTVTVVTDGGGSYSGRVMFIGDSGGRYGGESYGAGGAFGCC